MKARYEKVDDKTIRFIIEKPTDVTIAQLLSNRKELIEKYEQVKKAIDNIDEILTEATKLGIEVKDDSNNN